MAGGDMGPGGWLGACCMAGGAGAPQPWLACPGDWAQSCAPWFQDLSWPAFTENMSSVMRLGPQMFMLIMLCLKAGSVPYWMM